MRTPSKLIDSLPCWLRDPWAFVFAALVCWSLVCWSMSVVPAAAEANLTSVKPIAFAARIVGDKARARLIIDFDRAVDHHAYPLANPNRVLIDLPETYFSLGDEYENLPQSLITDVRFGTIAVGRSRVVLLVNGAVKIENQVVKKIAAENRHRLIIDLVRTDQNRFEDSVRKAAADRDHLRQTAKTKPQQRFIIVLDPGHGGIDGGATGVGKSVEKRITLEFAHKLRDQLERSSKFKVIMTRNGDDFVGLVDRVDIARKNAANLMVSIHADSLRQTEIRGATIYTLSEAGSDAISRSLAKKQNRADLIAGLALPDSKPVVSDILISMLRRETEAFSNRLARLMVERLRSQVRLIRNPHRSADFYVLKAPEVPSVLLELGYLSNREDEELMTSPVWQTLLAKETSEAINAFFSFGVAKQ